MAIEDAIAAELTTQAACAAVELSERRFRRWRIRAQEGDYARHAKPATVRPVNALTPEEHEAIREAEASLLGGAAVRSIRWLTVAKRRPASGSLIRAALPLRRSGAATSY